MICSLYLLYQNYHLYLFIQQIFYDSQLDGHL